MAAEGRQPSLECARTRCVNGAATVWPRKVNGREWISQNIVERQWGRDRLAAEGHARAPQSWRVSRVNGAATVWPRKAICAISVF